MYINFNRTNIAAGTTECGRKRKVGIGLHVEVGIEDGSDWPCYGGMVTMSATAPINRAGIEAGGTADTFQGIPER